MTDNLDQFDQSPEFDDGDLNRKSGGMGANLAEAWRTKPIFKLAVLMIGVAVVVSGVIVLTSSKPKLDPSRVAVAPSLVEAPGGKASPAFIEAQAQANEQRTKEAAARGETALPTPLPGGINLETRKETDPLVEFRAEMQRQKEEQQKQIASLQASSQQQQQITAQQSQQQQQAMSQAFQAQLQQLATLWKPKGMEVIGGVDGEWGMEAAKKRGVMTVNADGAAPVGSTLMQHVDGRAGAADAAIVKKRKALISTGTVNYAQMLTEANSDVQGPILAQILSGPLSGARAIGQFQVENELLVLTFRMAVLRGKEYPIEALALDPDTTLGGMASEVDHRYFTRLVLPAAASFVSAFGQKLAEKPTTTTVTPGGTVITEQASTGIKDGLYAGMGSAGQSISGFFNAQASQTKVLVRLAVGTPIGLFFTSPVCAGDYPCAEDANGKTVPQSGLEQAQNQARQVPPGQSQMIGLPQPAAPQRR